ncbi:MAG: hypothetical protein ACP5KJ_00135 [Candidatus Micrarchaeia archaeon]
MSIFNKVHKRSMYSTLKNELPERHHEIIFSAFKENPSMLKYFKKRSILAYPFVRLWEITKMIVSKETYLRKEEMRSALYYLCEKHLDDGEMRYTNMEAAIKNMLNKAINTVSGNVLKDSPDGKLSIIMRDLISSGIDTKKVLRDKEWYRDLIHDAAGAAAVAALLYTYAPEYKAPERIVEVPVAKQDCNCSLYDPCIEQLKETMEETKPQAQTVYKTKVKTVYKEVPMQVNCDDVCNPKIDSLMNRCYEEMYKKDKTIENRDQTIQRMDQAIQEYKMILMRKVDYIFETLFSKDKYNEDKRYYENNIRPWFANELNKDFEKMSRFILYIGGELFEREKDKKGKIVKVKHLRSSNYLDDIIEDCDVTYPGGNVCRDGNRVPGNMEAVFEFYKNIYKGPYGNMILRKDK